jgi:16S rRNA (cytosine967-C5)-methyltransferase
MLPAARVSAAIEVLDRMLGGAAIDPALTNWGRANRFAGSGDRAAIRDLVFDAWRCRRSYAALGGGETGRGLMLGRLRAAGEDASLVFTGIGHAPAALTDADDQRVPNELEALDCPEWLAPRLQHSLGGQFGAVMHALQHRAPMFFRVNLAKTTRDSVISLLAKDGIEAVAHPLATASLNILTPSRNIMKMQCYVDGLIEFQDAASQAVIEDIPLHPGQKVLDYCAGGGGKTLALAARQNIEIWAHDAEPARMRDLPDRAKRAGAKIGILTDPAKHAPYDLVLVDAPCSGSGSWRRDPAGKWALTEARLAELTQLQAHILAEAAPLMAQTGQLAYVTCSLLADENEDQIDHFLQHFPGWISVSSHHLTPLDGGDGFFLAMLTRKI